MGRRNHRSLIPACSLCLGWPHDYSLTRAHRDGQRENATLDACCVNAHDNGAGVRLGRWRDGFLIALECKWGDLAGT